MNNNKMNPNARLSFLERFAYGIGDYAEYTKFPA